MAVRADPTLADFQGTLSLFQFLVMLQPLWCELFVSPALLVLKLLSLGPYVIAYRAGAGRTRPKMSLKSSKIRHMRRFRYFDPIRRRNVDRSRVGCGCSFVGILICIRSNAGLKSPHRDRRFGRPSCGPLLGSGLDTLPMPRSLLQKPPHLPCGAEVVVGISRDGVRSKS